MVTSIIVQLQAMCIDHRQTSPMTIPQLTSSHHVSINQMTWRLQLEHVTDVTLMNCMIILQHEC
jgi:hypothetical protein